jgi:hypothetical protein
MLLTLTPLDEKAPSLLTIVQAAAPFDTDNFIVALSYASRLRITKKKFQLQTKTR